MDVLTAAFSNVLSSWSSSGQPDRVADFERMCDSQRKAVYTSTPKQGQIRLLKQTMFGQNHSYLLVTVDLNSRPAYHALSYVWGSSPADVTIEIDHKPFPVTRHLKQALEKMKKYEAPSLLLWIDAICIDQTNDFEKNVQVRQMTRIYETAKKVFVWLGDSGDGSNEAFDLLSRFGDWNDEEKFSKTVMDSFVSGSQKQGWAGFGLLLARPYWTRAWVFQELIVTSQATIGCGDRSRCWDIFAALAFVIEEHRDLILLKQTQSDPAASILANHHHQYNLALYQRQRQLRSPPSLSQALQMRRQAKATDPRDKVFSILGVCREEQAFPRDLRDGFILDSNYPPIPRSKDLEIRYEQSHTVADVYKGAAQHIIRKTEHLEILSACQNPDRRQNIPSWAPDWSTPRTNGPIVVPDTWGRIYTASGDEKLSFKKGNDSSGEVFLKGVWINTIEKIGRARLGSWQDVQNDWAALALRCAKARPDGTLIAPGELIPMDAHCLYNTRERISDAFTRTCVADHIEEWRVEPGHHLRKLDLIDTPLGHKETVARMDATENRRFAITDYGFMGLVPQETEPGDKVVAFAGADVLFVIRDLGDGHVVVGECYVHGFMHGEVCEFVEHGLPGPDDQPMQWKDLMLS